jgi:hypothetical protein
MEKDWLTQVEYEVEASKHGFGVLRSASPSIEAKGAPCWQALYRRTSPCPGCPLVPLPDRPYAKVGIARPGTNGRPLAIVRRAPSVGTERA